MTSSTLDQRTAATIRAAIAAAQRGELGEGCKIAEQALSSGLDDGALHALLGMLEARRGRGDAAMHHLRVAHTQRPNDPNILQNLADAFLSAESWHELLDLISDDAMRQDLSFRLARYRAFAAQNAGEFETAVTVYRWIVDQVPDDAEAWNNLGNSYSGLERTEDQISALRRAVELQPGLLPSWHNLGQALANMDDWEGAETAFAKGCDHFPSDARLHRQRSAALKRLGRVDEALAAQEAVVRLDPESHDDRVLLAIDYAGGIRFADAERELREVLRTEPSHAEAHTALGDVLEKLNRSDDLIALIKEASETSLSKPALNLLRVTQLRRERKFAEALPLLNDLPPYIGDARKHHLRGQIFDGLGRADEAWTEFEAMNLAYAADLSDPIGRAASHRAELSRETEIVNRNWTDSWTATILDDGLPTPVFLVGFPRSGTTLLDTLLMGHPAVQVLEEQPMLNLTSQKLAAFDNLAGMSVDEVRAARKFYFTEVTNRIVYDPAKLLIDKHPLHLNKVPLIKRLFPDAKFILALRHPADVLVSCFTTNFRLNNAMANFLQLDLSAEFYDLTFSAWHKASEAFPVDVHTVRYEEMVDDTGGVLRRTLAFLELPWTDEVLDHQRTALGRGAITTASYAQVAQPIYRRSSGRWTRYARQLEPVFPVLRPWAERFGYEL